MTNLVDNLSKLSLKEAKHKTGLVYDDRMIEHRSLWNPDHIERPERYIYSLQKCKDYDLVNKCLIIPSKFASEDEILLVHDKEYFKKVKDSQSFTNLSDFQELASQFDSAYFHPKTYECALIAAGSAIQLVSSILDNNVTNGMAIIRPPGHHAMEKEANGFCYFNNAAIAAKYALKYYNIQKILIVDWDIHHGQGIQQIFYDDPRVLYFSIHRYEHRDFWPNLRESEFDFVGANNGLGFNINVPLNTIKLGDTEYLAIFNNILLPVAYEFCPELIIISAGFDSAIGNEEGQMEVTPQLYPHLINSLSSLALGRICVILEGGYNMLSLSESVALTLRSLLEYPCPLIAPTQQINCSAVESILNVISVHRPFWDSLKLQNAYDPQDTLHTKHAINIINKSDPVKIAELATSDYLPIFSPEIRKMYEDKINSLIANTDLSVPECRTCLTYDPLMTLHINNKERKHPERADRVIRIYEKLKDLNLIFKCLTLESREATESELSLVHDLSYINEMKAISSMSNRDVSKLELEYESVYLCKDTYKSAALACGNLLQALDAIMQKKCLNGFAIVRPPGHHADVKEACGFCIFNSVAIAAKYLISNYNCKKILIIDWDIHHGNGTQNIFYESKEVLYISLHLYDGDFFPGLPEADYLAVGKDEGEGYNINIPWKTVMGDGDYLAAFFHIILPVAYEFAPDIVLVSAGFDPVVDDPLGGCYVTPSCFGVMTKFLTSLANGRVLLALEGGYHIENTSDAAVSCIFALLGEFNIPLKSMKPSESAITSIQNVVKTHKKYWKCLRFDVNLLNLSNSSINDYEMKPVEQTDDNASSYSLPLDNLNAEGNNKQDLNITYEETDMFSGVTYFCITPLEYCPHLELLSPLSNDLNPFALCEECDDPNENWVCLHCYKVYCGRYINQHMLIHGRDSGHYLTLSYSDLSVWCYGCEAYIHNEILIPFKQQAEIKKFGYN